MKYSFAFIVALFSLLAAAAPAPAPAPAPVAQDTQVAPEDMEARYFFATPKAPAPAAQEIQVAPKDMEAAPAPAPAAQEIPGALEDMGAGQFFATTRNELVNGAGPCPPAIFIFARGSTEPGNMGTAVGPPLASALKSRLGQSGVWIQGVGGPYGATLVDNVLPSGTNEAAIREMRRLFTLASTKCPNARILAGGYSQGTAVAAAAISGLDESTRAKIAGTVLFGYTKNLQNHGQIPNYPRDRLKVYCNPGDMVCTGSLFITAAHLGYAPAAAQDAPQFLVSRLQKTQSVT